MTLPDPTGFVVDDDVSLCDAIQWLLQSVNLNVKIYNNGQDYLENYDPKHLKMLSPGPLYYLR